MNISMLPAIEAAHGTVQEKPSAKRHPCTHVGLFLTTAIYESTVYLFIY